ncbi:MAG: signal peptide peptidase SppA [Candidatus Wallbacteria bacterium]|nr:signal peptide peptidase SppA [Candidatus Wallbacteria bacterium]
MRRLTTLLAAASFLLPCALRAEGLLDLLGQNPNKKPITEEFYAGDPLSKEKVALLSLDGVILSQKLPLGGTMDIVETLRMQLAYAAKDADLKGILLEIDSPGGGITASEILHRAMADTKTKGKKIVALMEDLAASGGYFVAAAADRIYAHPSTITGSIGVIIKSVNVEGLYGKIGLQDVTIKSSNTPLKDMLSSTRPMTEEEKKIMQGLIDQMYDLFVGTVSKDRNLPMEKVRKLADGRVYTSSEAKAAGLIDEIGFRDDALTGLYKLCGLKKEPKIVRYRKTFNLQDLFSPGIGGLAPHQMLEQVLTGAAAAPRFMYLWQP